MPLNGGRGLAWLVALMLTTGVASARDRALVIGVDHYPGITVAGRAGERDLGGAVFDAKTFAALLPAQFGVAAAAVHTLLDVDATRARIIDEINSWLIDGTGPGDRVFLYFAGHGAAVKVEDERAGISRMTSAIVPADAQGDLAGEPLAIKGMILGVEIRNLLDRLEGRQVTVVADSCQSGSVSRDANHPLAIPPGLRARTLTPTGAVGMTTASFMADTALRREAKLQGRLLAVEAAPATSPAGAVAVPDPREGLAVWSAATTDQVTFDLPDRPGGVFTQSFAEGLRDRKAPADGSGRVTPLALLNYVRDRAKQFCAEAGSACSAGLTPQLLAASAYGTTPFTAEGATPAAEPPTGAATAASLAALLQHANDFKLDVDLLPGAGVHIGQPMHIRVTSAADGQVAVFDLTPDGDLTQLFPNAKTDRAGHIRAGAPLTMPDPYWGISFKAAAPPGAGALLILVTEDGLDLARATGLNLGLKPVVQTSRLLQVIGDTVERPVVSPVLDVPTRAPRWAFVRRPYVVLP